MWQIKRHKLAVKLGHKIAIKNLESVSVITKIDNKQ